MHENGIRLVIGGAGDDTIYTAQSDTVTGGDGEDTFILTDLGEAGSAAIPGSVPGPPTALDRRTRTYRATS